ncbi:MAG: M48 family metallopeptidase [Pseudomonadota bacterium]
MIARGLDALHTRKAAFILRDALADWQAGRLVRPRLGHRAASVLAVAILVVPPTLVAGALLLAVAAWPSIPATIMAALLALMGLFLWPWRPKLPGGLLRAEDIPETFAQLDALSDAMDAPRITALRIEEDANASVAQYRGEIVLSIGALLWRAATPEERRAVLAHEIGHLINGDPKRGGVVWRARQMLGRWHSLVVPEGSGGESLASEVVQVPLTLAIEMLDATLTRLIYAESQRAEYLADALGARAASSEAMVSALALLARAPLLEARFNRLFGPAAPPGVGCVDWIAEALTDPPEADAKRISEEMAAVRHTVDTSHPPTAHRIAFLRALDLRVPDDPPVGGEELDAEWAPHLTRIGDRWRCEATVQ